MPMHRSLVRSSRRLAAAAVCALVLLAAGCEDEPLVPAMEINFVGTWREQPWQGTAMPHLAADSLFIFGSTNEPIATQIAVRASVRFDGPGTYPIPAGAAVVEYIVGGDAIAERYASLASDDAFLIIREHTGGVLTGRLTFPARALNYPAGTPAPEGRFDAEFVQAEVRS
jgi:hypothetical protein